MSALANRRIVIVAPASPEREALSLLERHGAELKFASAGADLLVVIERERPALVILGAPEHGLAELDLLREVRADAANQALPVLLFSERRIPDEQGIPLLPFTVLSPALLHSQEGESLLLEAVRRTSEAPAQFLELAPEVLKMEEQLRFNTAQLEAVQTQLEELGHEIKTPLGVIVGFSANLRDGLLGPTTPRQQEATAHIVTAARRICEVLDGSLEFIDQHRGRPVPDGTFARKLRRTQIELTALVREVVGLFSGQASDKSLRLVVEHATPVPVWADGPRLRQAVTNLVSNAIKFTPRGGTIHCDVRALAPDAASHEPMRQRTCASIRICDSGAGVPEAERETIFERGFRLPPHAQVPGQGIGLAICREVVQAHRGEVRVSSGALGGACFELLLPSDVRSRSRRPLVFIHGEGQDAARVQALLDELVADGASVETRRVTGQQLIQTASSAAALVVLPRGETWRALLEALREDDRAEGLEGEP